MIMKEFLVTLDEKGRAFVQGLPVPKKVSIIEVEIQGKQQQLSFKEEWQKGPFIAETKDVMKLLKKHSPFRSGK